MRDRKAEKAFDYALMTPESNCVIMVDNMREAKRTMERLLYLAKNVDCCTVSACLSAGDVRFPNGAKIKVVNSSNKDNLLGIRANLIVFDELTGDYGKDEIIKASLKH